jgi:hypothetical protein
MNKSRILLLTLLLLTSKISAQYISVPDYYQQNPFSVNPAYIPQGRSSIIYLAERDYMTSLQGAPTNLDFGAAFPVLFNASFGFKMNINKQSIFKITTPEISYSYQVDFKEKIAFILVCQQES